jgi:hypothetical protein
VVEPVAEPVPEPVVEPVAEMVPDPAPAALPAPTDVGAPEPSTSTGYVAQGPFDPVALGLPTDGPATVRYLSNSYGGVGEKTAEALVEALGDQLFNVLHDDPDRIASIVPQARAERVLEGWRRDFERRAQG